MIYYLASVLKLSNDNFKDRKSRKFFAKFVKEQITFER